MLKLSAAAAEPGSPVAFWDWHGQVEQHLRASGADWVILRANWYMSNLLAAASQVAAEGRLYAPAGEARIAMIDPRDVGAAAAAVLSSPGHERQTYLLTGPRPITYAEVAAGLSPATGSRVEFVDVPGRVGKPALPAQRAGIKTVARSASRSFRSPTLNKSPKSANCSLKTQIPPQSSGGPSRRPPVQRG